MTVGGCRGKDDGIMAAFKIKPSPVLPNPYEVSVSQREGGGWVVLRGGAMVVTDEIFTSEEDAAAFAKSYCSRWGDRFTG